LPVVTNYRVYFVPLKSGVACQLGKERQCETSVRITKRSLPELYIIRLTLGNYRSSEGALQEFQDNDVVNVSAGTHRNVPILVTILYSMTVTVVAITIEIAGEPRPSRVVLRL
jgi:hypothetical protein